MRKVALACLTLVAAIAWMPSVAAGGGLPGPAFGYPLAEGTFAEAMTTGPDNNLWFTGGNRISGVHSIGKVTLEGNVTEYRVSGSGSLPSLVSGPDGNLWFVEREGNAIGRSTVRGETISFPLPGPRSRPISIAAGPDGNLWFTEAAASKIGRITPSGNLTEFSLPPGRQPSAIAAGPDGNLWFTQHGANWIGRITTAGHITQFPVPGPWAKLSAITVGPDGNLWFAEEAGPKIGRITLKGRVTQFTIPIVGGTDSIVSGPEGKLWFAADQEVGAISTSGAISWPACLVPGCVPPPVALAVGPDGELWVGAGPEHCKIPCGGGTEIGFGLRSGGIGRYTLPSVALAIGPRASRVRRGETSLTVVCGQPRGCHGLLRIGFVQYLGDQVRRYRTQGKGSYDLAPGEAKRVRVRLFRGTIESLREVNGAYPFYVLALAGPPEHVQAKRGLIELALGG